MKELGTGFLAIAVIAFVIFLPIGWVLSHFVSIGDTWAAYTVSGFLGVVCASGVVMAIRHIHELGACLLYSEENGKETTNEKR